MAKTFHDKFDLKITGNHEENMKIGLLLTGILMFKRIGCRV